MIPWFGSLQSGGRLCRSHHRPCTALCQLFVTVSLAHAPLPDCQEAGPRRQPPGRHCTGGVWRASGVALSRPQPQWVPPQGAVDGLQALLAGARAPTSHARPARDGVCAFAPVNLPSTPMLEWPRLVDEQGAQTRGECAGVGWRSHIKVVPSKVRQPRRWFWAGRPQMGASGCADLAACASRAGALARPHPAPRRLVQDVSIGYSTSFDTTDR